MLNSARVACSRAQLSTLLSWALALSCALAQSAWGAGKSPDAGYVGASACKTCHPTEFSAWQGSHHDLAMQTVSAETVLGDFGDASFTHQGVTSRFFRRDGKFMVNTDGPDGALQDFEIAYVFGVEPLQQYLIEFPGGRLQVLGVSWDTRPTQLGGQRWFHIYDEAVPAGDVLHWTGPNQNWNHMCAECHSTDLRKGYRSKSNDFATLWSEIDVACESCHGPGAAHLEWARRGKSAKGAADLGLALRFEAFASASRGWRFDSTAGVPKRARPPSHSLELDTCARCHSRRSVTAPHYEFGRPLLDTHRPVALNGGLYFADGQIQDEVYVYGSFVQSAMHAAGVTCSDCHDSHSLQLRAPGNQLCGTCHEPTRYDGPSHHHHEPGSEGASCVSCHMPERTYMQVDARRDHGLRVPRPDLSDELGTPNACTGCHLAASNRWAAKAVRAWRGGRDPGPHWSRALHAGRSGAQDAEAQLMQVLRDAKTPPIVRATAISLLPSVASSVSGSAFEAALRDDDPQVRGEAVLAVESLGVARLLPALVALLDDPAKSVALEAARALAGVPPDRLEAKARMRRDALLVEYRALQAMDGDRAAAHLRLASLDSALGDTGEAERELKIALERSPSFIPAYVNLADLYRRLQRDPEGEVVLRKALQQDSEHPDVHHALGLLLVRGGRLVDALPSLERAAELRPELARYAYVHGLALHSAGQNERALQVLRAAQQRHPGNREIAELLAQIGQKLSR